MSDHCGMQKRTASLISIQLIISKNQRKHITTDSSFLGFPRKTFAKRLARP